MEFSPRDMVHSVLSSMGSQYRGLGSHRHTLASRECSELKVLAWEHSANDVFVNVQILMGAVERGNSGGSEGKVFCSLIWPFEKESYEAQISLGVTT